MSALSQLSAGLAGGLVTGDATCAVTAAQAGKNAAENNSLSAKDEKQRQDAKWSLPYIKDAGEKASAEKLVADLDAKDKAFDTALDKACQGLSSDACNGMRQELAAMGGAMMSRWTDSMLAQWEMCIKDGADKIAVQQWQCATADAKVQRDADVQRIAQNWGVSPETVSTLYDTMTAIHNTAAIGGAVYGMKTNSQSSPQGPNHLDNGKWVDVEGLPLPVPPSVGAAGRVPNVLQSDGNTLSKSTAL